MFIQMTLSVAFRAWSERRATPATTVIAGPIWSEGMVKQVPRRPAPARRGRWSTF